MKLKELKEILDMLPEECLDYQVDVCYSHGEYDNTGKWIDNTWYDWLEQIQVLNDKKKIVLHGDYTCIVDKDGIYTIIDENNKDISGIGN